MLEKPLNKHEVGGLRAINWEEATEKAYRPMWAADARKYAPGLAGLTPERLPEIVPNLSQFGMEMLRKSNRNGEIDSLSRRTNMAIGSALAVALRNSGWALRTSPGEPVCAERGEERLEPFDVLGRLAARRLGADEWRRQYVEAGIAGMDLGKLVPLAQKV